MEKNKIENSAVKKASATKSQAKKKKISKKSVVPFSANVASISAFINEIEGFVAKNEFKNCSVFLDFKNGITIEYFLSVPEGHPSCLRLNCVARNYGNKKIWNGAISDKGYINENGYVPEKFAYLNEKESYGITTANKIFNAMKNLVMSFEGKKTFSDSGIREFFNKANSHFNKVEVVNEDEKYGSSSSSESIGELRLKNEEKENVFINDKNNSIVFPKEGYQWKDDFINTLENKEESNKEESNKERNGFFCLLFDEILNSIKEIFRSFKKDRKDELEKIFEENLKSEENLEDSSSEEEKEENNNSTEK